jgi:hypothetical protein
VHIGVSGEPTASFCVPARVVDGLPLMHLHSCLELVQKGTEKVIKFIEQYDIATTILSGRTEERPSA